jgi:hypothetical protein
MDHPVRIESTVKLVCGMDCSPPNLAEVKNAYFYASTSPYAFIT